MLLCCLQNDAIWKQDWIQQRPFITQYFGMNPQIYSQFGMKGHNGLDYRAKIGTPIFSSIDGRIKVKDSGKEGYGLHVKIRNPHKACEVVIGHCSKVLVTDGQRVSMGDKIALSGNSGFSSGPHIHEGFRLLKVGDYKEIFKWEVLNYDNGFKGYIDHLEFILNWKGGFLKNII